MVLNISSHSRLWDNRTRDISPTREQDSKYKWNQRKKGCEHHETLTTILAATVIHKAPRPHPPEAHIPI